MPESKRESQFHLTPLSSLTTSTWIWLLAPMIIVLALSIWTYIKERPDSNA